MPDKLSTALALPDTPNVGLSGDYVEVKRKGPELYSRLVKIMTKPLPFFCILYCNKNPHAKG